MYVEYCDNTLYLQNYLSDDKAGKYLSIIMDSVHELQNRRNILTINGTPLYNLMAFEIFNSTFEITPVNVQYFSKKII